MNPRVSVVMPVYNGARTVAKTIDSILKQTFTDLELVIVDDASSDHTWAILSKYAASDPRIVIHRNATNQGVAAARNNGLARARGEFIAVHDADDISVPHRLAVQVAYLDGHPEAGAVGSAARRVDARGRLLSIVHVPDDPRAIRALLLLQNPLIHATGMIRHHLIRKINGYQAFATTDDYDLWWRLSRLAEIHTIQEPLVDYGSDAGDRHRLSVGKASRQLEESKTISLQIAKEIMAGRPLDEAAYQRFFLSTRGVQGSLQPGDVRRLQSLWDFLASDAVYCQTIGPKLLSSAFKNLSASPREALQLLAVANRQFGLPWTRILKRGARLWLENHPGPA
ncbi:MAG: glycosyltransferase family 2 protein [Chloroflexi bacterium]|nr:glycosyltransferase family 2 protein [Chloroflexota bacterium]